MNERLRQRDQVKVQLVDKLNYVIQDCFKLIDTIEKKGEGTLGGQLQNVWDIFYKLGELNILAADYLFEKKD